MKTVTRNVLIGGIATILLAVSAMVVFHKPQEEPSATPSGKAVLTVTTALPQQKEWPLELAASGGIVAWKEAVISAETGGLRITALHADVGDWVKQGQLLAELSRKAVLAEVRKYEASLASAKASLAQAKADADRARLVKSSGALSEQQINQYLADEKTAKANVELAEAQLAVQKVTLSQTRILAVDDGLITSRSALLGQVASTGDELFRLQRRGRLEWRAEVDSKQLNLVKPGAEAELTLPTGKSVRGTVRLAEPTLSSSTSRAYVFVRLPRDSEVKAGIFANGYIQAGRYTVLAVPESAVVLRDGRSYVFEVGKDNKVIRRIVTTGWHREGLVEIAKGLSPRARIVTSGGGFLSDGDLVTITREQK